MSFFIFRLIWFFFSELIYVHVYTSEYIYHVSQNVVSLIFYSTVYGVLSDLGYEKYNMMRQDPALVFLGKCGPPDGAALAAEQNDDDEYVLKKKGEGQAWKDKILCR